MISLFVLSVIIIEVEGSLGITQVNSHCFTKQCKSLDKTQLYDNSTYGGTIHPDPYTPILHNSVYRDFVNTNIQCTMKWCNRNYFYCTKRGDMECFHVEHIIDKNGKDYQDCP